MNRLLPQSLPIIPESCLTVPRYVFCLLVISEGTIIVFAENQLRQNERVIPNAWHRVVRTNPHFAGIWQGPAQRDLCRVGEDVFRPPWVCGLTQRSDPKSRQPEDYNFPHQRMCSAWQHPPAVQGGCYPHETGAGPSYRLSDWTDSAD